MYKSPRSFLASMLGGVLALLLTLVGGVQATTLSDNPIYSSTNVPANLMLALSVEFPTGTVAAYANGAYSPTSVYLGYFDGNKCYDYDSTNNYFYPVGVKNSDGSCSGGLIAILLGAGQHWSGNMLNWATMTSLDEFRQSLTGGNRGIDTATTTTLLRSNLNSQSNQGNFNYKCVGDYGAGYTSYSVIGDPTFGRLDPTYRGSCIVNFPLNGRARGTYFTIQDYLGNAKDYNTQIKVCVTGMLESNCNSAHASTDYPNAGVYNKPDGLIQQNYTKIRVGASAYTFRNGNTNPNGGIRALLRDNGPDQYNGNGPTTANPYTEWDKKTGIFATNPDTADVSGTAPGGGNATQSGAINYLNEFGYDTSNINSAQQGYETYDSVADLYWATLAYLMQVPLDSSYTSGLTSSNALDTSFPVLTGLKNSSGTGGSLNDPISYSCQSNSILTIGDSHTHYDTQIPGSTISSGAGAGLAALLANGTVPALNAATSTTALGNLPLVEGNTQTMASALGVAALGNTIWSDQATYYIAGLAYYAHINDIRADIALPAAPTAAQLATQGKQTVTSYAVDVLEPGTYDGTSGHEFFNPTNRGNAGPSIYWLEAKYGGFNDVNSNGTPANFLTWHTNSSTGTGLRPDNYYPGNRPDLIQSGLQQIFTNIASSSAQSGAGPSVTSTRSLASIASSLAPYYSPVAGFPIYNSSYKPITWDGDVSGYVAAAAIGSVAAVSGSVNWSAQGQLENLTQSTTTTGSVTTVTGWNTGRRVITSNGTTPNGGVPFRYASLSAPEQSALGSVTAAPQLLNFLRGDKSNEQTMFRGRTHILGDIVDSQAVLVQGAASPYFTEAANPGYSTFQNTTVVNRAPVVYVGSNDGMMHAFAADFTVPTTANPVTGGGSELFAYVPSILYQGPNNTPQVNGLAALANLNGVTTNNYSHHFYVDRTPQIADVDFNYTSTIVATATTPTGPAAPSTASSSKWHTLLVGGLGKGGKGIYALDVTSVPSAVDTTNSATNEAAIAKQVLWEFTAPDMGYSYGRPLIVKTRKYGWVVAMTSGYNNTSGNGHVYILNPQTGALLETINVPTSVGSASNPIGLTQATGYTQNVGDSTVDQIYVGDLLGDVWRFDLTGTTGLYPAPTLFAKLADASGNAQPITTAPRIELAISSNGLNTLRWVFVGTGQFLDSSDLNNGNQQTMYALRDGSGATPTAPATASTATTPNTAILTRSSLVTNDLVTALNLTDSASGWYYDLPNKAGTNGGTERIVVDPDATNGATIITWASITPSSNPCSLLSNVYAADFSGVSVLVGSNGSIQTSIQTPSVVTGVQVVQLPNGSNAILAGGGIPGQTAIYGTNPNTSGKKLIQQVNWREILD